jgi:hypothetical protein
MDTMTFSIAEVELDTPVCDSAGETVGRVDGIISLPSSPERDAAEKRGELDHQYLVVAENPLLPWKPVLYIPFSAVDRVQLNGTAGPACVSLRCTRDEAERLYQHKPT